MSLIDCMYNRNNVSVTWDFADFNVSMPAALWNYSAKEIVENSVLYFFNSFNIGVSKLRG